MISFHDQESVSDIIHTVHSILQRSPEEYLKEMILVNDNAEKGTEQETGSLPQYV